MQPSSVELLLWLLLLRLVLLLLSADGRCGVVGADVFSMWSWSSLQYKLPPSLNANSSPGTNGREQAQHLKHFMW